MRRARRRRNTFLTLANRRRRKRRNPSAYSVAAGHGYPYIRGEGRIVKRKFWASRFTKTTDGRGPALYVYFDARGRAHAIKKANPRRRRRRR